jgi:acyl transferase domain-containing protein
MANSTLHEIAIIGLSCRAPSAPNKTALWTLLERGEMAFSQWPEHRWAMVSDVVAGARLELPQHLLTRSMAGGFLEDVDAFDSELFGISPREARAMDPQQRLLLEECWQALLDAAIAPPSLGGKAVGVFMGLCSYDYGLLGHDTWTRSGPYSALGAAQCLAANRISHALNLVGPSLVVDAACASSLVALHLAAQSLGDGSSDLALAGGANLVLAPTVNTSFDRAGMLSKSGRCRVFDKGADGYVRSEAAGVAVLKRREDAERDGDPIYAVIEASVVRHDGRTEGIVHPSRDSQLDLLQRCWRTAGIKADDLTFIEAHGTGTSIGDALELEALSAALDGVGSPCYIGSLKGNIGHAEAAAGILSAAKVALALQKRALPPHVGADDPLPLLAAPDSLLVLPRNRVELQSGSAPLRAGISAFGFGGTICHLVLRAVEPAVVSAPDDVRAITLSAPSEDRLRTIARRWAEDLGSTSADRLGEAALWSNRCFGPDLAQIAVEVTDVAGTADRLLAGAGGACRCERPFVQLQRSFDPPVYPFLRKRYWFRKDSAPLEIPAGDAIPLDFDSPTIRQHRIADQVVVPGAAIMVRVLEAVAPRLNGRACRIENVMFHRPIVVAEEEGGRVILHLEPMGTDTVVFRVTAEVATGGSVREMLYASGLVKVIVES